MKRDPRMRRGRWSRAIAPALAMWITCGSTPAARACATCMGDPNSDFGAAANAAVIFMICCVGTVLALICACALTLYRRSRNPLSADIDLTDDFDADSDSAPIH